MTLLTVRDEFNEAVFTVRLDSREELRRVYIDLDRELKLSVLRRWIMDKLMAGTRPISRDHECVLVLIHQALLHPAGLAMMSYGADMPAWVELLKQLESTEVPHARTNRPTF